MGAENTASESCPKSLGDEKEPSPEQHQQSLNNGMQKQVGREWRGLTPQHPRGVQELEAWGMKKLMQRASAQGVGLWEKRELSKAKFQKDLLRVLLCHVPCPLPSQETGLSQIKLLKMWTT